MKRFRPRMLIPLLLLALILSGWYVDTLRAKQRSTLSGFFESQPTEVASRIQGRVAQLCVKEGDTVQAGQQLVEMETAPVRDDTAAREAQAEQARQQLREMENGPRIEDIRKQQAVVAEQTADLARLRNGPLPEEIAQAKARLQKAQATYRKLQAGNRPQEIAEAQAAERNAAARLAQAVRGLTPEEKAEAKARLDSAIATEDLARQDADRYQTLYNEDAVSKQQLDQKQADLRTARAKRHEEEEAWKLAETGTPAEEMEQYRQSYQQAKAALDLALAGSRKEDIQGGAADVAEAKQALAQLQRGSRQEDIQAAEARLAQAQDALNELLAGNRKEQIAQARAAALAAKETARSSQANLVERIARAPFTGVVERIPVAVGDLVNPGTTLLRLSNPQDIWLRVYVPEANLAQVTVNAEALLKVDGITGPLPAYVESVATQGEFTPANLQTPDDRGKQVFSVRIRLKQPDPRVKAGMAVTVKRIGTWEP